jgi:Pvc16 N-terminal domain
MALGDDSIIGDVTQTLVNLLGGTGIVTLDSPATLPTGGDSDAGKLNLFLYHVLENPHAKNREWLSPSSATQEYPPLALNLYYLLTPYAKDAISAHSALSHAMAQLHDNSIVPGSQLFGSLSVAVEQLAIVLCPVTLEELTRIWNALQSPYRLSVCYEARIALLRSSIHRDAPRVSQKVDVFSQV